MAVSNRQVQTRSSLDALRERSMHYSSVVRPVQLSSSPFQSYLFSVLGCVHSQDNGFINVAEVQERLPLCSARLAFQTLIVSVILEAVPSRPV